MNKQTIIRTPKGSGRPYFTMTLGAAQDDRLSFEARGLLCYLLSKPDDWEVKIDDLKRAGNCGRDRIYRILEELLAAGYLERIQERDEQGRWQPGVYLVHEVSILPVEEQPLPENLDTEKADTYIIENIHKKQELTDHEPPLPPPRRSYRVCTSQAPYGAQDGKDTAQAPNGAQADEEGGISGDDSLAWEIIPPEEFIRRVTEQTPPNPFSSEKNNEDEEVGIESLYITDALETQAKTYKPPRFTGLERYVLDKTRHNRHPRFTKAQYEMITRKPVWGHAQFGEIRTPAATWLYEHDPLFRVYADQVYEQLRAHNQQSKGKYPVGRDQLLKRLCDGKSFFAWRLRQTQRDPDYVWFEKTGGDV